MLLHDERKVMSEKEGIPSEKKSPYSEPQQRPESARKAPLTSPHYTQPRTKSAKAKQSQQPSSSSHKRKKKKKHVDEKEKEIKQVSKVVRQKLELYINDEKRQNRFNPDGTSTTTRRMAEFDIAYKLLEYDKLEQQSPRNPRNQHSARKSKSCDPYDIQPTIEENSRRVTGYSEVDRLSKYASEVFASYPIEKLAVIHRYRPHPREKKKGPEVGDVLGYTGHVGAALHQQAYVDFYLKEGMDNSNPGKSPRMQRLPKSSDKHSSKNTSRSSVASKSSSSQDSTHKKQKKDRNSSSKLTKKSSCEKPTPPELNPPSESASEHSSQHSDGSVQGHSDEVTSDKPSQQDQYNGNDDDNSDHTKIQGMPSSDDSDTKVKPNNKTHSNKSKEAHNTQKKSVDKTWEYYESSNVRDEGDSDKGTTGSNDDGQHQDLKHSSEKQGTSERSDAAASNVDNNTDVKDDADSKSMRSYVSIEYVREVDIKDI